jgi:2-dehydropantoate 2-reductase
MRVVIVGPGAIGCLLAGVLSRGRHEVWLLDHHRERASLLNHRGVWVSGVSGEFRARVRATAEAAEAVRGSGPAELVVMAVKSFDTRSAAARVKPLVGPEATVLTLQNGLGNVETLQEEVGAGRVVGGVTALGATLIAPGQVHYAGEGVSVIGEADGELTERVLKLAEMLSEAGLQTEVSTDLTSVLWAKLAVNAGLNPVGTLAQVRNGGIMESRALREVMREAVGEAAAVAKAKGVRLPNADMAAHAEEVCRRTANNVNSMLQDVLRKRRTEVDAINGAVVEHGQATGTPTPTNRALLWMIHGIEETYAARFAR